MDDDTGTSREPADHPVSSSTRLPAPRYVPPNAEFGIGTRAWHEVKISETSSIWVQIHRTDGVERWRVEWPPQMSAWRKWHWRARWWWRRRPLKWRELWWWFLAELFNLAERAGLAKWVGREITHTSPVLGVRPFRD